MSVKVGRKLVIVGILILLTMGAVLVSPFAGDSLANAYWAGNHYTCWGIKADIRPPVAPFQVEGMDFVPSWVSTCSWEKPGQPGFLWYWTQTGYVYQPAIYPNCRSYYEKHTAAGDYDVVFMSDQAWNFSRNYQVRYVTSINGKGEWGIYVNDINKQYSFALQDGALDLQAYTESHDASSDMEGIFRNVKKRSQAGFWYPFDHANWRQDWPYHVDWTSYDNYNTDGGL